MHSLERECLRDSETHLSAPRRAINSERKSSTWRSFTDRLGFKTKSNPVGMTGRAKNFSNPSLHSISVVGLAEFARCRQPKTAMRQPIPQRKHHKGARYYFCAPFINLLKLCCIPQSKVFRKCVRSANRHRLETAQ